MGEIPTLFFCKLHVIRHPSAKVVIGDVDVKAGRYTVADIKEKGGLVLLSRHLAGPIKSSTDTVRLCLLNAMLQTGTNKLQCSSLLCHCLVESTLW
jgi:hypothetical protein